MRPDVAKELTFTARIFSGEEAYALGLATRLSETPYDDAMALAAQIAGNSPDAVRGAKALFNGLVNAGAAEQFADERRVIGSLDRLAEPGGMRDGELREASARLRRSRLTPVSGAKPDGNWQHDPGRSCDGGLSWRLLSGQRRPGVHPA